MALDKAVDSAVLDAGLKQIADAIRAKAGTTDSLAFPQAMADAVTAIAAGGDIRFETGTVTFAEETKAYTFTNGNPDIFMFYIEPDIGEKLQNTDVKYTWGMIQDDRITNAQTKDCRTCLIGYNTGSYKYYAAYNTGCSKGVFNANTWNSKLAPRTYRWFAIWGVTVQ